MSISAPPIARCPHCGMRWIIARMPAEGERGQPFYCLACSTDYEIVGGRLEALVPQVAGKTLKATDALQREQTR